MARARTHRALVRSSASAALLACACSVYDASLLSEGSEVAGGAGATSTAGQAGLGQTSGGTSGTSAGGTSAGGTSAVAGSGAAPNAGSVSEAAGGAGAPNAGGAGGQDGGAGEAGATQAEPDACPGDPDKTSPGKCGCGVPEKDTPALAACQTLISKLIHRYDFEGTDTAVLDRVGTADGVLKGASLSKLNGKGVASLGGGSAGAYVDLPNRLLSSLTNATLESWVTWGGGSAWQRVFDFGDSTSATPEDNPKAGNTYLMLTPKSGAGVATVGFSLLGNASGQELDVSASVALPQTLSQVVVVASATDSKLRLYINGKKISEAAWTGPLSAVNDVNAWLGRSQFDSDPELLGVFHEFRVYGAALSDAEVATSFIAGPDPVFLAY